MISLHYTSHTKAYNTIYAACNIVEAIYSFTQICHDCILKHSTVDMLLGRTVERTNESINQWISGEIMPRRILSLLHFLDPSLVKRLRYRTQSKFFRIPG